VVTVYDITGKYWSPERKLVDEAYKTIPKYPYSDLERFDNYFVDVDATLEDFAGYIQTWSGFQKFKSVEGNEKAAEVINDFLKESKSLCCFQEEQEQEVVEVEKGQHHRRPQQTTPSPLRLRTCYFMLLGTKP
jgi:uncharacterized protein (DUF1330 family)